MRYPWMDKPLEGDIGDFLAQIDDAYESGQLSVGAYHVALGKAMGYVECRFSDGRMSKECAYMLLHDIERMTH